jgi:hypothetical protein
MAQPQVPGDGGDTLSLPCDETKSVRSLDLGMREFECGCGDRHAVVMDIETTSEEMPEFGTAHLLGIVLEEFPESVVSADMSDDGDVGAGIVWVTDFDARRLHEIVVELVVEVMEHAVSHADDDAAVSAFERRMGEFDVAEFVEVYREERDLSEDDVYR